MSHKMNKLFFTLFFLFLNYPRNYYCMKISLSGEGWSVSNISQILAPELNSISINASVPGDVYSSLFSAGRIPNPYLGYNDVDLRWIAMQNWTYRRIFD